MNGDAFLIATAAALAVGAYAVVARGLLLLAEPFRRRACVLARQIATRSDVSDEEKIGAEYGIHMLDKAWVAWLAALIVTPAMLIGFAQRRGKINDAGKAAEAEGNKLYTEYSSCVLVSVLANSPIAAAFFSVQIIPLVGLFGSSLLVSIYFGRLGSMIERLRGAHHLLQGIR